MKILKKQIVCLLFLALGISLGNAQDLNITGSCIVGTESLVYEGDVSNPTFNGKTTYFNGALNVNYQSEAITTVAYIYFALAAEIGTPENRWVVAYGGQPYYYFISESVTPPAGEYLPFDPAAIVSDCGGSVFISIVCNVSQLLTGVVPTSICAGSTISVPFTASCITAGNTFTAQLSDALGSFATPVNIGTLEDSNSGNISCIIPAITPAGSAYRIRVISSTPSLIGEDNGSAITVNPFPLGDTFATAIDVTTPTYSTTGDTSQCYTNTIGSSSPDVWYRVTLDACATNLTISTCSASTTYDSLLRVYAADGVPLFSNDDTICVFSGLQSTISNLDVSAHDVVYVLVEGFSSISGNYGLTIDQVVAPLITYYADTDEDGFGDAAVSIEACDGAPIGYVSDNTDCDDITAAINPAATEICWNNIDDNCDNTKSEGCIAIPVFVNNPVTITNFSTHLSAIPYTYPGATSLDYRFEVTNTSVTPNQTIEFTQTGAFARYFTIPVGIRGFNTTYSIRASAVINGEEVPYVVPVITVISTGIPTVKLSPTSCGANLSRLNATISANPGFNASSYEFRIRLTSDNGATPTYYYAQSLSRFIGANSFVGLSLQYGTSYSVSVQYTTSSVGATATAVTSDYGDECIITTPSMPLIGLNAPQCGSTLDRLGATISASPAAYAQQYQFRVRLTSDNGMPPTYYTTLPSASRYSSLVAAQGLVLANDTQYSVSVRYSIPVAGGGAEFSAYGPECVITTPSLPTTTVSSVFCDLPLGNQLNQSISINTYPGNPIYRIKLEERQGSLLLLIGILDTVDPVFSLNMFSGTTLNKDYEVSVAMKLNDVFGPYGNVCRLKTYDGATPERTLEETFTVRAYPNPFSEGFQLNVTTANVGIVSIKTYDMLGRLIEERSSKVSAIESISIGANYPSGIYNVIVSQEDEIRTVRVVKR